MRAAKHAQTEALQQICKESLGEYTVCSIISNGILKNPPENLNEKTSYFTVLYNTQKKNNLCVTEK